MFQLNSFFRWIIMHYVILSTSIRYSNMIYYILTCIRIPTRRSWWRRSCWGQCSESRTRACLQEKGSSCTDVRQTIAIFGHESHTHTHTHSLTVTQKERREKRKEATGIALHVIFIHGHCGKLHIPVRETPELLPRHSDRGHLAGMKLDFSGIGCKRK